MHTKTDQILALSTAAILLAIGSIGAAPVKKNAKKNLSRTNFGQSEVVIQSGAPETDAGLSPSASPSLDNPAAPSREGQAPSAAAIPAAPEAINNPLQSQALYQINWQSINIGGETSTSPGYMAFQSIGQESIGQSQSASYITGQGYWYGAPVTAGPSGCACDCHADPGNCDGVQTVLDVVQQVNVAFRNAAAIPDPNPNCPRERTDVNCDGVTTVVDVVKMVNVAFRNGNPLTEFCNPCP